MSRVVVKKLIEKIEGEAKLEFNFQDGKVEFVNIIFESSRAIEEILRGKNGLDALVINPRVCGICGHAHLIATVKALENCFDDLQITQKATILRELTLNFEIISNHIKWFYLTLFPLLGFDQEIIRATKASSLLSKAIAVIAGQYPHNSYSIVGGVVSDLGMLEIIELKKILKEVIEFFTSNIILESDSQKLLECERVENIFSKDGDLPKLLQKIEELNWHERGKSFDRFIVFGESSLFKRGKSISTRVNEKIDEKYIQIIANENSLAKNVQYKGKYYEVGPLSRAMLRKKPLIKDAHRRYADSIVSRILARVCESLELLHHSLSLISSIDLSEASYIKPKVDISELCGSGVGSVEAARGSLIHKVKIDRGIIQLYQIITPTQWNLSNGTKEDMGVSQKAMIGSDDENMAEFIFKSFDLCSVCTTH
jgi:hydrogenase large subunit